MFELEGKMDFREFLARLEPDEHMDRALFEILADQLPTLYKLSGKPLVVMVEKIHGNCMRNDVLAKSDYYMVTVWGDMGKDGYMAYVFATEAVFKERREDDYGRPIYSVMQSVKFINKAELISIKSEWEQRHGWIARATAVYPIDKAFDTKVVIDGFMRMYYAA